MTGGCIEKTITREALCGLRIRNKMQWSLKRKKQRGGGGTTLIFPIIVYFYTFLSSRSHTLTTASPFLQGQDYNTAARVTRRTLTRLAIVTRPWRARASRLLVVGNQVAAQSGMSLDAVHDLRRIMRTPSAPSTLSPSLQPQHNTAYSSSGSPMFVPFLPASYWPCLLV